MSYMSLGQMGFAFGGNLRSMLTPGGAEIDSLQSVIRKALSGSINSNATVECWKAKTVSRDQAKAWVAKYNELKAIYPEAMAKAKFSPCTAGNSEGYRPLGVEEWFNAYFSNQVTKIDMTPAVNTVAAGTPGSWNVSGTQQTGILYGYNFQDQASAQNYAQAVVDSGGTATMYQVPPSDWADKIKEVLGNTPKVYPMMQKQPNPVPYIAPTSNTAPLSPDQVYNSPILPPEVVNVPQQKPVQSSMASMGLLALAAVPMGAYLYFKNR